MKRAALLLVIVVHAAACDSEPRRTLVPSPSPIVPPGASSVPTPSINSITPGFAIEGSSDLELKLTGTNFSRALQGSPFALWSPDGVQRNFTLTTTFAIETELRAVIPAARLIHPGAVGVTVMNGDIRGLADGYLGYPRSNSVRFRVMPASYFATLRASPSCASTLPPNARERMYSATLLPDGRLDWTGPTLNPPAAHNRTVSGATISEDVFSFFIDVDRDLQSDFFEGLWDDMGAGTFLTIAGKGNGTISDEEITGNIAGLFAFYDVWSIAHFCEASDHRFRFVKQ